MIGRLFDRLLMAPMTGRVLNALLRPLCLLNRHPVVKVRVVRDRDPSNPLPNNRRVPFCMVCGNDLIPGDTDAKT